MGCWKPRRLHSSTVQSWGKALPVFCRACVATVCAWNEASIASIAPVKAQAVACVPKSQPNPKKIPTESQQNHTESAKIKYTCGLVEVTTGHSVAASTPAWSCAGGCAAAAARKLSWPWESRNLLKGEDTTRKKKRVGLSQSGDGIVDEKFGHVRLGLRWCLNTYAWRPLAILRSL